MPTYYTAVYLRIQLATATLVAILAGVGQAAVAADVQSTDVLAHAANPAASARLAPVMRDLVDAALAYNLELAAAGAGIDSRLAGLDEARARYLPALDFAARYSAATGGRTIDVPVGDLVNPIYAALERLEPGQAYPRVANQQIAFLRHREQETKFVLSQPLFDARLGASRAYAAAELESARISTDGLRERVTLDMQQAYLALLAARANVAVLDATLDLARENLKANESLYRNGKATRDLVYRAEADLLETTQRRLTAANAADLGRAYVNQLRNQPLDAPIAMADVRDLDDADLLRLNMADAGQGALARLQAQALEHRRELRQLDANKDAALANEALARAGFKPTVGLSVEAGTQGETYGFSSNDRYVLASVVLRFNLFDGGADRAAVRSAHALAAQLDSQRADTENRIRVEVQRSLQDFVAARASIDTAKKRLDASSAAFAISQKKRDLGAINQTEFIDARRALTDAALNLNQTRFQALSSLAALDYATGRADRTLRIPGTGE